MNDDRTSSAQFDQVPGFALWSEGPARIGPLWIGWTDIGIAMVHFGAPEIASVERVFGRQPVERELPPTIAEALKRYFGGEDVEPAALTIDLRGATKFQRRVWTALRRVLRGQVRSYGALANDAGSPRAMRAVGTAMAHNPIPIFVPCHRCVAMGNVLGGFSGGLDRKRFLLELEGVRVDGDRVLPGQLDLL